MNANMDALSIHSKGPEASGGIREHTAPLPSNLEVLDPVAGSDRSLLHRSDSAQTTYRVYKRRFFGLSQLVLLNIIVSWDWLSFSPVSATSAEYFDISETAINWLSTSFLFSFCVASPFTIYTIHKAGPKAAIIAASCLLLVGNWTRYAGTRAGNFGAVMFGQILVGLAQPFVLSAPTRYSDVWFSEKGRVSATAVASLANPFGGALAQLIDPLWATKASDIPNMILYVSIIVSPRSNTRITHRPIPNPPFSQPSPASPPSLSRPRPQLHRALQPPLTTTTIPLATFNHRSPSSPP